MWPIKIQVSTVHHIKLYHCALIGILSIHCSDHAKLLWQRIPKSVKQSNGEIPELWEIGKRLWRRDFAAIYELAQNPAWPPHIAPLVTSLIGKIQYSKPHIAYIM